MNATPTCHLQLAAAVRLRREAWGGVAFDRAGGDLLELDPEGFAVLATLQTAQTLPDLQRSLGRLGHRPRRPELVAFLRGLEHRGLDRSVEDLVLRLLGQKAAVPVPICAPLRFDDQFDREGG